MIKTAQYIQFEDGFIKEAVAQGCDEQFLRGYIDEADRIVDVWKVAFDELADQSTDPNYRVKLANELLYFNMKYPELLKQAGFTDTIQNALGGMTDRLGIGGEGGINQQLGGFFAKPENKDLISSLIAGGGGGGLIGLLMGVLTGHPMVGLMLGGLGGMGLGAGFQQNWFKNLFDKSPGDKDLTPAPAANPVDGGKKITNDVAGMMSPDSLTPELNTQSTPEPVKPTGGENDELQSLTPPTPQPAQGGLSLKAPQGPTPHLDEMTSKLSLNAPPANLQNTKGLSLGESDADQFSNPPQSPAAVPNPVAPSKPMLPKPPTDFLGGKGMPMVTPKLQGTLNPTR